MTQDASPIKGYEATYIHTMCKVCITCKVCQPASMYYYTKEEIETLQANGDYFAPLYKYALDQFPSTEDEITYKITKDILEDVQRNSTH